MSINNWVTSSLVLAVVVIGGYVFTRPAAQNGQDGQSYSAAPGPFYTDLQEFAGGLWRENYLATTTTDTAMPLLWSVINKLDMISVMPLTSSLTYTFQATSSGAFFLPKAGMTQETCFFNATTTANVDLVFAAGTGVDLEVASSSATALGSLRVGPTSMGCFTFVRQTATSTTFDITAAFVAFEDAD